METLRRGGSPEGIVLEPDSATLAACGLDRSMSVWEHIWEDNAANQASFARDREKIRDAVVGFMEEHPTVGRHGPNYGRPTAGCPSATSRAKPTRRHRYRLRRRASAAVWLAGRAKYDNKS